MLVSPAILVFLWMLSLSLKNEIDNLAYPAGVHPRSADARQLRRRCSSKNSIRLYFWNSIVVSGGATLIALLVGVPAGYGIARARTRQGSRC